MAEPISKRDLEFMLYEWLDVESLTERERFAEHSRETFDAAESESMLRGYLSKALFDAGLYCRADDRGDPVVPAHAQVVALGDVVREHHPRAGTQSREHGEQHVALERLRLVDDDEGVVQRAATDVRERQHLEQAALEHLVETGFVERRASAGQRLDLGCVDVAAEHLGGRDVEAGDQWLQIGDVPGEAIWAAIAHALTL